MKRLISLGTLLVLLLSLALPAAGIAAGNPIIKPQEIADYLFDYGKLPDNFITKKEAQNRGWDSSYNYVSDVAPGYSIGGDRFGNYEGQLPTAKGRQYYECDCNYVKGKRNAERIIFSNDGLVYYTNDHYATFTEMTHSETKAAGTGSASALIKPQDVADYLFMYGELPANFVTKKQAQKNGWENGKNLSDYMPGYSLGGDTFGNREGLLPAKKGRQYYECDVNYTGGKRGKERIVFSNDGLVYYSPDSFKTFKEMKPSW